MEKKMATTIYIGLGFRVGMKEWKRTCQVLQRVV